MSEFLSKRVLITGGLGFIGSNLARRLVGLGADVTLVDSLIPQYGGNFQNIADIRDRLTVNICDVRDPFAIEHLVREQHFLFNLSEIGRAHVCTPVPNANLVSSLLLEK